MFDGVYELLVELNKQKEVYFATINKQNYNLEICGLHQEKIAYTNGSFKVETYATLVKKIGVDKSEVVVIGDNIFDDWVSAKKIGVKCFLVNRYQNKIKSLLCKLVNGRYLK